MSASVFSCSLCSVKVEDVGVKPGPVDSTELRKKKGKKRKRKLDEECEGEEKKNETKEMEREAVRNTSDGGLPKPAEKLPEKTTNTPGILV